ncbi:MULTISPECIES: O-phosphoserine--tRNA ligase [unclassified Archaeoglobus]|jgi:O-phosphoseryl-tRNA synthetase|uniref:O-phosphoserine--tRNA ligase n=1 Tax=unclassified Archaeoglobus TaxID=2643606 RepID=UPI0025C6962B|nr:MULTISPECIES: O-phosphoserine--tRNA ligase [unclassified Archaeoglobus]
MRFDPQKYRELSRRDFEEAWKTGKEILGTRDPNKVYPRIGFEFGAEHPVFRTIERLRRAYLSIGFSEVVNPVIVEDVHVRKQFGKEALAVLDRCFYLASLPKPNVGMSAGKISLIEKITGKNVGEAAEDIKKIFHRYKKGEIDGDDLSYLIAEALDVDDITAVRILDEVFPEFKELKPLPSNLTLRSHMTTGWFITLSHIADKLPLPIKLFSIDRCFRKEQGEDATRLYSYFSASCVLVDEDVDVDDGKAVAEALLRQFGFEKFKFRKDEKRSKYYIPDTQTEVYAFHPKLVGSSTKYSDGWIEIATFGIYSPTALAEYDIQYPVMNLGLGVERLAMILHGYDDVRKMVYPQIYGEVRLSDTDIARGIKLKSVPQTVTGLKIAKSIAETAEKNASAPSPCKFLAYEGDLFDKTVRVFVVEEEENTKLCGPAYANEVVVYNGDIYGIPRTRRWRSYFEEGVTTGIRYIDAISYLSARKIEEAAFAGDKEVMVKVRVVENLSDINLYIQDNLRRYILWKRGKIDVRGPVFVTVKAEVD